MRPLHAIPLLALLAALSVSACRQEEPPPSSTRSTGHRGPVPSAAAQALVASMQGHGFNDEAGVLGGGRWTVVAFGVIPNPVSAGGKGPVVVIQQDKVSQYLPVESDGDVIDLHRKVFGREPQGLHGSRSRAYEAIWRR